MCCCHHQAETRSCIPAFPNKTSAVHSSHLQHPSLCLPTPQPPPPPPRAAFLKSQNLPPKRSVNSAVFLPYSFLSLSFPMRLTWQNSSPYWRLLFPPRFPESVACSALPRSSSKARPTPTPKRSCRCGSGSSRSSPTGLRWSRSPSCRQTSPCPGSGVCPQPFPFV